LRCAPANFLSDNPRFCISALKRYTPRDFLARVEAAGIAWHEKTLGQLFCDVSSQQIIDLLLADAAAAGVVLQTESEALRVQQRGEGFSVTTNRGEVTCASLVVATGGPSIPKMGATGYAYELARQFGLAVVPPRPALVPFTFDPLVLEKLKPLSGISTEAVVSCGKTSFREALLFTHRGLSGPAVLQISSYWRPGDEITVNLLPDSDAFELLRSARSEQPRTELHNLLAELLPRRLAAMLCEEAGLDGRLADLSDKKLQAMAGLLNRWRLKPGGSEGYRTAEVTAGGVDTDEISSKTFEANKVPGLYFIGECLDVTGWLGGYNFQWAWASGHAAGQVV
jgi:predicted Rossmann fold flavoprotein